MKTIVCISDLQVPYHDAEAVKAIEAVGSQSGKTAKPVMIADAGQIA